MSKIKITWVKLKHAVNLGLLRSICRRFSE